MVAPPDQDPKAGRIRGAEGVISIQFLAAVATALAVLLQWRPRSETLLTALVIALEANALLLPVCVVIAAVRARLRHRVVSLIATVAVSLLQLFALIPLCQ